MLKQLLRNEQDTRTLCGVVFDTYIVSSQLNAVVAAKAQTQAYNDAVQQKGRGHGLGPPFIWAWAGLVQGLITAGTKLGRGAGAALGSHGRVEQAVDRGEVRDGQTLLNRQDFPATAVQGHSAVETLQRYVVVKAWKRKEKECKDRDLERHWHENFKTGWRS